MQSQYLKEAFSSLKGVSCWQKSTCLMHAKNLITKEWKPVECCQNSLIKPQILLHCLTHDVAKQQIWQLLHLEFKAVLQQIWANPWATRTRIVWIHKWLSHSYKSKMLTCRLCWQGKFSFRLHLLWLLWSMCLCFPNMFKTPQSLHQDL